MKVLDSVTEGVLRYQMSLSGANGQNYEYKQMEICNVLVNGNFKTVVFHKDLTNNYNLIAVANTYNSYYKEGISESKKDTVMKLKYLVNPTIYKVSKEEGNDIYRAIKCSKRVSKVGKEYYIWNFVLEDKI